MSQHTSFSVSGMSAPTHAPSGPRTTDPFAEIAAALSNARILAARVEELRDRLVGPGSENQVSASKPIVAGVFFEFAGDAEHTQVLVTRAIDQIAEIERALP